MSFISNLLRRISFTSLLSRNAGFQTLASPNNITSVTPGAVSATGNSNVSGGLFSIFIRTKVRCYFPKPREVKRIKVHGWKARMSTPEGRRVLMRRILKGRHVLSH